MKSLSAAIILFVTAVFCFGLSGAQIADAQLVRVKASSLQQVQTLACLIADDSLDLYSCPTPCPNGQAPATVFKNGAEYDTSLSSVCLDNLGIFNAETGARTATNYDTASRLWLLNGKYLQTDVVTQTPTFTRYAKSSNNFTINPAGTSAGDARQSSVWGSEVHLYYYINDYRKRIINNSFVNSLGLPSNIVTNLNNRQFRPDLAGIVNARLPRVVSQELLTAQLGSSRASDNDIFMSTQQRALPADALNTLALDPEYVIGAYTGIVSSWVAAGVSQWPSSIGWGNVGNTTWKTDVRPAILEGFKMWNAYRFAGRTEVYKYAMRSLRRWNGYVCGGNNGAPCNKGWNIDNVMMYLDSADPALNNPTNASWPAGNSDDTLLFPYGTNYPTTGVRSGVGTNDFGPRGASLGGMFIGALFYDLSKEVGLGDVKADMLFWKTMSLIDPAQAIDMTTFGQKIQQAARALWPTISNPALSWYEQDLVGVLASRGVKVNGVANPTDNIPAPIGSPTNPGPGTLTNPNAQGVGSAIPESQRNSTTGYNFLSFFSNTYNVSTPNTQYTTYQFYKYSKYGPCDGLDLTNGTINSTSTSNPVMSYDGSMAVNYGGRSLGNMVLMSPGTSLTFLRRRQSCVSEKEGYYAEDVRPTGFRVIKAIPNGFTYKVIRLMEDSVRTTYQLTVVDPSLTLSGPNTGPATYNWSFTEFDGTVVNATGQQVTYAALKNQPFTLYVERIRGSQNDNMTLRERGNDLDRNAGKQFNQDFWNAGYPVGFDTIVNRRLVEGHGSYNSALNPVGGAFGVQGRRWTTPNATVQPLRFSTVSHGLGSGSNQGGAYRFQDAVYYNACIWGDRDTVTNFPGCTTNVAGGTFETQVPFSQVGIDLNNPFALVTAGSYPGYLWTVTFPNTPDWRLQPNREYYFGSHISASVVNNGYSYNVCSYAQAPGTAGQANDRSDWLAGANWSGVSGAPPPQTMRSYLGSSGSVSNCTFAAYKFEGQTVVP